MMVHDTHCHFLSTRFFEALAREKHPGSVPDVRAVAAELDWEPPGSAGELSERWLEELDRNGVTRAALMGSVPGDEEAVATAVGRCPERFVGWFTVNPTASDAVERATRAFGELGLRCACLFPAMHRYAFHEDSVARIFEVAAAHQGAIFAHCGYLSIEARTRLGLPNLFDLRLGDPLALSAVAVRFPGVPVIVPHFGSGFFREALMALDACPTIHLDTSSSNSWIRYVPGLTLADVFRRALAVAGPARLVFGTDSSSYPRGWRRVIYGAQRTALDELGADAPTCEQIFSANFDRIFPRRTP